MNTYFCRTSNFILFVCVVYFIHIAVSPGHEPGPESTSILTALVHKHCFDNIHRIFRIDLNERQDQKEYMQYAIAYLRYPTDQERDAFYANIPNAEELFSPYLLFDAHNGKVLDNVYVFGYHEIIKNKYDLADIRSPEDFCDCFLSQEEICKEKLQKYGLKKSKAAAVKHAFLNKVLRDFGYLGSVPKTIEEEGSFLYSISSTDVYYPIAYMFHISRFIRTHADVIVEWPEEYCRNTFH